MARKRAWLTALIIIFFFVIVLILFYLLFKCPDRADLRCRRCVDMIIIIFFVISAQVFLPR